MGKRVLGGSDCWVDGQRGEGEDGVDGSTGKVLCDTLVEQTINDLFLLRRYGNEMCAGVFYIYEISR
jgi:hypothetical protein